MVEQGRGEIRKGTLTKAVFGLSNENEYDATGIFLDLEKKVISPPIKLKVDNPFKVDAPFLYSLSSENQSAKGIFLLILDKEMKGVLLTAPTGEIRYIFPQAKHKGIVVFYEPDQNKFYWHRNITGEAGSSVSYEDVIFTSTLIRRGVVFDIDGGILGISVTHSSIFQSEDLSLQWEKYWEEKPHPVEIQSAARILGDIKLTQNKLTASLDRLLSIAELQPVGVAELPPHLHLIIPPSGLLRGIQQAIWNEIRTKTEPAGEYSTPVPFQANDIQTMLSADVSAMDIQRTLELLERIGLIVAITYEGVLYYRLPTDRDMEGAEK